MVLIRNVVLTLILIVITYTDLKRREIDNEPIILGFGFIVLFSLCGYNNVPIISSIIGFLIGGIFFAILAFWGMGGGDIKLMALVGFFLGWKHTIVTMFLAFIIGAVMGAGYIIIKKKDVKEIVPFGPSIAMAVIFMILFGNQIIMSSDLFWIFR